MTLSIIVVSLPGLKPLLSNSKASKTPSTVEEEQYTEQSKGNVV
jgi:hypothetical protein